MTRIRVNELDLLRFLAVLMVVFFHYAYRGYAADNLSVMPYPLLAPVAQYGYLGVELFFLISGFVILMTAASGSWRGFIISRCVRLYPAFWAACTLTFIVTRLIGGERFHATLPQYLVNMTMLNGFAGVRSIDNAYWSLFVELRFYALVTMVLLLGQIQRIQPLLIGWTVVTAALEFLPVGLLHNLLIYEYAPYFIAGATFYVVRSSGLTTHRVGLLLANLVLALRHSLAALPALDKHYQTHFAPMVVGLCVVVFFAVMFAVSTGRTGPLGQRSWVTVGALTYPVYLMHQNIGYMVFNALYPAVSAHVLLWGTVALMCVAARVLNTQVEARAAKPLKRALARVAG